jgi:hypothetical protein
MSWRGVLSPRSSASGDQIHWCSTPALHAALHRRRRSQHASSSGLDARAMSARGWQEQAGEAIRRDSAAGFRSQAIAFEVRAAEALDECARRSPELGVDPSGTPLPDALRSAVCCQARAARLCFFSRPHESLAPTCCQYRGPHTVKHHDAGTCCMPRMTSTWQIRQPPMLLSSGALHARLSMRGSCRAAAG